MDAVRGDLHVERAIPALGRQRHPPSRQTTISMRTCAKFGLALGKILCPAGLALTLAFSAGARPHSDEMRRSQAHVSVNNTALKPLSIPVVPESATWSNHREVISYVMGFEGDHSLDVATVVEQVLGGYASYTVHLHLASGTEQSIVVKAPPGGLQIEMHDMTGDRIPNDLVLRPALLCWLPTILLNDGHDHFAVAISSDPPSSLSSGQELASRGNDGRGTAALISSCFKVGGLPHEGELFPQFREHLLSSTTNAVAAISEYPSSSGRAPPALVASF
jgi:hypothetical protein